MRLANTRDAYGAVSITLHWCAAAGIVALLVTGLIMWLAPDHAAYLPWVKRHAAIGTLLWLVLVARIAWHAGQPQPVRLSANAALNRLASFVHVALLGLIGLQLLTGPLDVWSSGYPIDVFGWFAVPSPIGDALKVQHDALGDFHALCGATIAGLLALHLAGVAKHVLIDRDGTLRRMLAFPPPRESQP